MWHARTKWVFIGDRFGLDASELDAIDREQNLTVEDKFRKMVKKWLETGEGCTWRAVDDALKHPTVGMPSAKGMLMCSTHNVHL